MKIPKREDVNPETGKEKYGEHAHFADPTNAKYPLDTPEHIRAAAHYWGMEKNKSEYASGKSLIGKRIEEAMDKLHEESMKKDGYVKGEKSGMMIKKK